MSGCKRIAAVAISHNETYAQLPQHFLIKALKFRHYPLEKCYTLHLKAPEKCYNYLDLTHE